MRRAPPRTRRGDACGAGRPRYRRAHSRRCLVEGEPVEAVRPHRQQVGQLADARKVHTAEEFHWCGPCVLAQVELNWLREAREVVDAQHHLAVEAPQKGEHGWVRRVEGIEGSLAEDRETL